MLYITVVLATSYTDSYAPVPSPMKGRSTTVSQVRACLLVVAALLISVAVWIGGAAPYPSCCG